MIKLRLTTRNRRILAIAFFCLAIAGCKTLSGASDEIYDDLNRMDVEAGGNRSLGEESENLSDDSFDEIADLIDVLVETKRIRFSEDDRRDTLVSMAQSLEGKPGKDCSAFIHRLFLTIGYDLTAIEPKPGYVGRTMIIHHFLETRQAISRDNPPLPGDIVFFDNTYLPRNRPVPPGNPLTHIGIVVKVDNDLTIHFLHAGNSSGRIKRAYMNLSAPHRHTDDNRKVINSFIGVRRGYPKLTGELFNSFGKALEIPSANVARNDDF